MESLCALHQTHHGVVSTNALIHNVYRWIACVFTSILPTPQVHQLWPAVRQIMHLLNHLLCVFERCRWLRERRLSGANTVDELVVVEVIGNGGHPRPNQLRSV